MNTKKKNIPDSGLARELRTMECFGILSLLATDKRQATEQQLLQRKDDFERICTELGLNYYGISGDYAGMQDPYIIVNPGTAPDKYSDGYDTLLMLAEVFNQKLFIYAERNEEGKLRTERYCYGNAISPFNKDKISYTIEIAYSGGISFIYNEIESGRIIASYNTDDFRIPFDAEQPLKFSGEYSGEKQMAEN